MCIITDRVASVARTTKLLQSVSKKVAPRQESLGGDHVRKIVGERLPQARW